MLSNLQKQKVHDDVKRSAMSETESAGETSKGSYISALLKQKSSEDDKTCEVRISGKPELKSVSSEKKPRQLDIIQHEEKAMISIMVHLEIQKEAITSATRMGKFRPESIRPRIFLVKFCDKMTAYKVLASAFRKKQYDGTADEKFKVYIGNSLNKTEQEQERKILKKRRSLIEENTDPSRLKVRNLELFLDGAVVDLSEC